MTTAFYRPSLQATQERSPDPLVEVEGWVETLRELLQIPVADMAPADAYDLLAAIGRLERTRRALVQEAEAEELLAQGEARLEQHGVVLGKRALEVPDPQGWLDLLGELREATWAQIDEEDEVRTAIRLLEELDDAEIVLAIADRSGVQDPKIAEKLRDCADAIVTHADVFLVAGVYIQAIGMSFSTELFARPDALAGTMDKYVLLLDALEESEADVEELDPDLVFRQVAGAYLARYDDLEAWRGQHQAKLAASTTQEIGVAGGRTLRLKWQSRDGKICAILRLPSAAPPDGRLRLEFWDAEEEREIAPPRGDLSVAGVKAVVEQGVAWLPLASIVLALGPRPELLLDGTAWMLVKDIADASY